jgi:hypothetical protein
VGSPAQSRCEHPAPYLLEVGQCARWCGVCGALNLDSGPVALQWLQPRSLDLARFCDQLRRLLGVVEASLSEEP